jgi:multidrug efflux system membrane fusion protein
LQAGDRVVTSGFARLSDGSHITVSSGDATQPIPPTDERGRNRRGGDGNLQSEERPRDRQRRSERSGGSGGTTTSANP